MVLDEYKDKYLNYLVGRGRTNGTKNAYDFDLTKFLTYLNSRGIDRAEDITTPVLEDFLFCINLSSATRERRRISIRNFFEYLFKRDLIKTNPTLGLESIKVTQRRPEYLSSEQRDILLKTIEHKATPYYKARDLMLVRILLETGIRRAEVTGLNVSDVDLSKSRLKVVRKGQREEYVIIHHELAKEIRKYLSLINRDSSQPLFLSKKGGRLSSSSIWHLVKAYARKAGFSSHVTVHSLRHSFATALLQESVPLPYIQMLMGHKSPQTTARYMHIHNSDLIETFNKVSFERR